MHLRSTRRAPVEEEERAVGLAARARACRISGEARALTSPPAEGGPRGGQMLCIYLFPGIFLLTYCSCSSCCCLLLLFLPRGGRIAQGRASGLQIRNPNVSELAELMLSQSRVRAPERMIAPKPRIERAARGCTQNRVRTRAQLHACEV